MLYIIFYVISILKKNVDGNNSLMSDVQLPRVYNNLFWIFLKQMKYRLQSI